MSSPTKLRQMAKELGWPPELEKAADQLQKLKRENAALRERLDSVQKSHFTLSKDNAALRADKERLDWLDHNAIPWTWMSPEKIDGLGPIVVTWKSNRTLRAAIDAARKEAQP